MKTLKAISLAAATALALLVASSAPASAAVGNSVMNNCNSWSGTRVYVQSKVGGALSTLYPCQDSQDKGLSNVACFFANVPVQSQWGHWYNSWTTYCFSTNYNYLILKGING